MWERISVKHIVFSHLRTLSDANSNSVNASDIWLFFGTPALITVLLMILFGLNVNSELGNALFTGLAIFAGLLFNLLVLVYDIVSREDRNFNTEEPRRRNRRVRTLREVFDNVSYAILVALAIVFLIGVLNLAFNTGLFSGNITWVCNRVAILCRYNVGKWLLDFLILTLSINFVLTLLMVLRRVHLLLSSEFRTQ